MNRGRDGEKGTEENSNRENYGREQASEERKKKEGEKKGERNGAIWQSCTWSPLLAVGCAGFALNFFSLQS